MCFTYGNERTYTDMSDDYRANMHKVATDFNLVHSDCSVLYLWDDAPEMLRNLSCADPSELPDYIFVVPTSKVADERTQVLVEQICWTYYGYEEYIYPDFTVYMSYTHKPEELTED